MENAILGGFLWENRRAEGAAGKKWFLDYKSRKILENDDTLANNFFFKMVDFDDR